MQQSRDPRPLSQLTTANAIKHLPSTGKIKVTVYGRLAGLSTLSDPVTEMDKDELLERISKGQVYYREPKSDLDH